MSGPLLGRDPLWFDSCMGPPHVSDHSVFAFWVVTNGRFDCNIFLIQRLGHIGGYIAKYRAMCPLVCTTL